AVASEREHDREPRTERAQDGPSAGYWDNRNCGVPRRLASNEWTGITSMLGAVPQQSPQKNVDPRKHRVGGDTNVPPLSRQPWVTWATDGAANRNSWKKSPSSASAGSPKKHPVAVLW